MDYNNYSSEELARMRYYLKEMEDKFSRCPNSFVLRNGIARVREILGLPKTVTRHDPGSFLDNLMLTINSTYDNIRGNNEENIGNEDSNDE